jgi:hypothetical protein
MGNAKINHPSRNLVDLMTAELNIALCQKKLNIAANGKS